MVAPLVAAAAVSAAVSVVGTLYGQAQAAKSEKERKKYLDAARAEWDKLPPQLKAPVYERIKRTGFYTPEMEQEVFVKDSEFNNIKETDPTLRQAQLDALAQLKDLSQDGRTLADDLAVERSKNQLLGNLSSQQAAIQENMARRGVNSPGMELVQKQMASQNSANQMRDLESEVRAQAQARALQALMQRSNLAGQMSDTDYKRASDAAAAQDAINQFRASNSQGVMGRNTDRTNEGSLYNIGEDQRISDANTGIANAEKDKGIEVQQGNINNDVTYKAGRTNQLGNAADFQKDKGQATRDMWGNIIGGVNTGISAYAAGQTPAKKPVLGDQAMNDEDEYMKKNGGYYA